MGDSKVAAMIFLFLGAFLLWLHSQGKLIPLFQQLFGEGLYGQKAALAKTTSGAASATSAASVNLGSNPSLLTILSAIPTIVNGKVPATTTVPVVSPLPAPTPPAGSPGPLPGFPANQPGAAPPTSSANGNPI